MKSPLKTLRLQLKKIVDSDVLPDYRMTYDATKDQVTFYNRKGVKAARAKFNDDMKDLFASKPEKKRSRKKAKPLEQALSFEFELK